MSGYSGKMTTNDRHKQFQIVLGHIGTFLDIMTNDGYVTSYVIVFGDPVLDVVLHLVEALTEGCFALSMLYLQCRHLLRQANDLAVFLLLANMKRLSLSLLSIASSQSTHIHRAYSSTRMHVKYIFVIIAKHDYNFHAVTYLHSPLL